MNPIQDLVNEFNKLPSWEDRYNRLIKIGKELPEMPNEFKTEDLKVKGCQSQVWLKADMNSNGTIIFQADSDAILVRGLIAVLLKVFSGRTPKEILDISPDFVKQMGFDANLSPSRANGLMAMIKQIKFYAIAYAHKSN